MSASRAFQKAIIQALKADVGVAAFVGDRIYDQAPADAAYPLVTIGPSSVVPDNAECIRGREETVQLDIWDRSNGLMHPCRAITDAVYAVFDEVTLTLDDPYANVECRIDLAQVFGDPDGITAHGVVQVTGMVERED